MQSAYDAERALGDRDLALRTFELIDNLFPADADVRAPGVARVLWLLADHLREAKSPEAWRSILDDAETGFANEPAEAARRMQATGRGDE